MSPTSSSSVEVTSQPPDGAAVPGNMADTGGIIAFAVCAILFLVCMVVVLIITYIKRRKRWDVGSKGKKTSHGISGRASYSRGRGSPEFDVLDNDSSDRVSPTFDIEAPTGTNDDRVSPAGDGGEGTESHSPERVSQTFEHHEPVSRSPEPASDYDEPQEPGFYQDDSSNHSAEPPFDHEESSRHSPVPASNGDDGAPYTEVVNEPTDSKGYSYASVPMRVGVTNPGESSAESSMKRVPSEVDADETVRYTDVVPPDSPKRLSAESDTDSTVVYTDVTPTGPMQTDMAGDGQTDEENEENGAWKKVTFAEGENPDETGSDVGKDAGITEDAEVPSAGSDATQEDVIAEYAEVHKTGSDPGQEETIVEYAQVHKTGSDSGQEDMIAEYAEVHAGQEDNNAGQEEILAGFTEVTKAGSDSGQEEMIDEFDHVIKTGSDIKETTLVE